MSANETIDSVIDERIPNNKIKDHIKYRIKTKGCKLRDLPLYGVETKNLFKERNNSKTIWECSPTKVKIKRFNETWVKIDTSNLSYEPLCYYRSLKVGPKGDKTNFVYGKLLKVTYLILVD